MIKKILRPFILVILGLMILGIGLITIGCDGSKDTATKKSVAAATEPVKKQATKKVEEKKPSVPREYKNALIKAELYGKEMHMSKAGIYEQLVSPYGEKFSKEAAKYAIANARIDYKREALEKAKDYQKTMAMSSAAIMDQLTSTAGEMFTEEEAKYAIQNLPK